MAAGRKLQAEIEKVLKKVEEGIEEFNNVWENVHSATHANQREKFEAELKTQIKKLQRDREQIKTWQSDKSIKDKNALAENRKKIEVEMERFKDFEREAKTKQYSKEGLSKTDKVDPYEEERAKHRLWIQESMDKLHVQIDELEAEQEAQGVGKKSKSTKQDEAAVSHSKHVQETHRWHATKLEQLLRKLDNDDIKLDDIDELRDSVEYYVDDGSRSPGEFQAFETIYESFALEDVEDYLSKDKERRDSDMGDIEKEAELLPGMERQASGDILRADSKREEELPKAPSKRTGGGSGSGSGTPGSGLPPPSSPSLTMRPNQRVVKEEIPEQKSWPPMVSVWQNPPPAAPAEREKAPQVSASGLPPKTAPNVMRPTPTLPPPMQPAPDRPPPVAQIPLVLNAPLNQGLPKPAPHQPPQMQPPTQAPPQPPLPSPPLSSPTRPQAAGGFPGTLAGIVSATPMPPPPSMAPPAPQEGHTGGPGSVAAAAVGAAPGAPPTAPIGTPATASGAGQPTLTEPPATAPPPPPPPVLPPPPPSPAPAPGGPPPSTKPSLPPDHLKSTPPAPGRLQVWSPPAPFIGDDRLQQAPKVPPPSEAPPPPVESPPPPPPDGLGPASSSAVSDVLLGPAAVASAEGRSSVVGVASRSTALHGASLEATGLPVGELQPPSAGAASARVENSASLSTTLDDGSPLCSQKLRALDLLMASHCHLPLPSDSRRHRKYVPRNPYVHLDTRSQGAYPSQPTATYEDPAMFEKYDLDTLFFIFYYQQGSYQQHLAAKELKKLSWRYHTKYLTWFQRHEEPRMTASDFERGAYVYFDHDAGWCQRIKSDFTFEYQFLEDEPM